MFSSQPSAWGTHGGSLDQERWIQLRIPPDGHSHGGGHRIHLEQGKTGFEQQHFGEMSLVWQAETSPGIAGGQLWSSGRWRLSLSAKTSKHQNHQTPSRAAAVPQPGPVHHETVKFGQHFRVLSAHKPCQVLQAVPVLLSKSNPETLKQGFRVFSFSV